MESGTWDTAGRLGQTKAKAKSLAINLDPKIYDAYVGQYKLIDAPTELPKESGDIITITKEDDHLYVEAVTIGKVRIYPETETSFFIEADNTKIRFLIEDGEKVTGMTIDFMGLGVRLMNAKRLDDK